MTLKAKIREYVELHQTKNSCTAKETIDKVKRQPRKWGEKFANRLSDKGLISKIYELLR